MPGNKAFYDSVVLMPAKHSSTCPDCHKAIQPGDGIVYMPEFSTSIHLTCFHNGPLIYKSDPLLDGYPCKTTIDPKFPLLVQFRILLYRLAKRAGKKVT